MLAVPVDLALSAHGNIEALYRGHKQTKQKIERTKIATDAALARALVSKGVKNKEGPQVTLADMKHRCSDLLIDPLN